MKRRTMCVVVMLVLLAAPGWAAPARISSPVDQVFHWLGQIWRAVWAEEGGFFGPYGNRTAAQPAPHEWAETGNCIDPNGRPAPCPGESATSDGRSIGPGGSQ